MLQHVKITKDKQTKKKNFFFNYFMLKETNKTQELNTMFDRGLDPGPEIFFSFCYKSTLMGQLVKF